MKQSIYERITSQVIANLESAGSWQKMWQINPPVSLKGHIYQGINHLLLSCSDYTSPVWATFNQVRQNGGSVKKGEKSSLVVFWKRLVNVDVDPQTGKPRQDVSFLLRYYNVFNTEQCEFDDIGQKKVAELTGVSESIMNERHSAADQIIDQMPDKPEIIHCASNPCYIPAVDQVRLPDISAFKNAEAYYHAIYHEIVHSTGHPKRLDRIKPDHHSDKHAYSREELVAELGSAFLCTIAGIEHNMDNTTAYVKSWLSVLRNNPSWVTWAASRAQKACEYISPKLKETKALVSDAA